MNDQGKAKLKTCVIQILNSEKFYRFMTESNASTLSAYTFTITSESVRICQW